MKATRGFSLTRITAIFCSLCLCNIFAGSAFAQPTAAVPDEVAYARPSATEIALARESLDDYLSSLDADMLSVVQRFPELIEVRPPAVNTAIVPALARGFFVKHNNNLEVASKGDIDVLFMGDSITDFWRNETGNYAGKPVLDRYFGELKVANFGIAGDTTQGVLYRLQNGEGEGFSPKAIMLMIGTNNTRANSAAEIAEGVGAIVLEMQQDFPEAKILLLGVFPRGAHDAPARDIIADINSTIERLHDNERVFYLDIGEVFLDAAGDIPLDVMSDGLHPTMKGYELWAEAVTEPLHELLQ